MSRRGTNCYRAPELLQEKSSYTNKSDIWALGCILFEVACGLQLFKGDWEVQKYSRRKSLPRTLKSTLSSYGLALLVTISLHRLMDIDHNLRPKASEARNDFRSYGNIFSSPINTVESVISTPTGAAEIQDMEGQGDGVDIRVGQVSNLACAFKKTKDTQQAVGLDHFCINVVDINAALLNASLKHLENEDFDGAIAPSTGLVILQPASESAIGQLTHVYRAKGDADAGIAGWRKLNQLCECGDVRDALKEAYIWRIKAGDGPIATWEEMLDFAPWQQGLQWQKELRGRVITACEAGKDIDEVIAAWYGLVDRHCSNAWLQGRLEYGYRQKGIDEYAALGWLKLFFNHIDEPTLRESLKASIAWNGDPLKELEEREEMARQYPNSAEAKERVRDALEELRTLLSGGARFLY
jgi:Protein kinase domain